MLEDKLNGMNGNAAGQAVGPQKYQQYQDYDFSGEDEAEYEVQQQQPMSLEQQKEELKRKLQMIS